MFAAAIPANNFAMNLVFARPVSRGA